MASRKKWWNTSVFEYSFKAMMFQFLANFSLVVGIILGADDWLFEFNGTFEAHDIIFPCGLFGFCLFFMLFRKQAKKEYHEKNLGQKQIYDQ